MRSRLAFAVLLLCATVSEAQSPHTPGIAVLRGSRSLVVVRAPLPALDESVRGRLGELVQSCRAVLNIPAPDSAALVEQILSGENPLPGPRTALELVVIPVLETDASCPDAWLQAAVSASLGVRIGGDTIAPAGRGVSSVQLRLDGRNLTPTSVTRGRERRPTSQGVLPTGLAYQRLTVEMDDLAPPPMGKPRNLTVVVVLEAGDSEEVLVPGESLRDVWQASLAARVATLGQSVPVVDLPLPINAELRAAADSVARGEASSQTLARVTSRAHALELMPRDRSWARAQSTLALSTLGDTLGVRLTVGALLEEEPCFRWADGVPAQLRELTAALAPTGVRCRAAPLWVVAARGLIAPGFGRPLRDDRSDVYQRVAVAGVVIGTLLRAQSQHRVANENYDRYYATVMSPPNEVPGLPNYLVQYYLSGERARGRAHRNELLALVLWGGHGAASVINEWRFARRVNSYGRATVSSPQVGRWMPTINYERGQATIGVQYGW